MGWSKRLACPLSTSSKLRTMPHLLHRLTQTQQEIYQKKKTKTQKQHLLLITPNSSHLHLVIKKIYTKNRDQKNTQKRVHFLPKNDGQGMTPPPDG